MTRNQGRPARAATRGTAGRAGGSQLRSTFLRRAEDLIRRLSENAPESVLEKALAAPSDFGGIARLLSDTAAVGVDLSSVDPLAESIARGAAAKEELLREAGGAWSSAEVGKLLGITRQAVDKRRRNGRLLAVRNAHGDHVYPIRQFADGAVVPGLDRFLSA
ncbi:MAG TPA: hypothetical protein VFQ39_00525, partial [Longimicrobium sp.]|nr:hypothetical protein [Longimicrobium sp.]